VPRRNMEEGNQLDTTKCFIEHVICSTRFGQVYAHHQELAAILLVWPRAPDDGHKRARNTLSRLQVQSNIL